MITSLLRDSVVFAFCLAFATSMFPATVGAQAQQAVDASQQLLGQPSQLSASNPEPAISHEDWKNFVNGYSNTSKISKISEANSNVSKTEKSDDSTTQATLGTWFQSGHSGAWFNSFQNGHGLFVEVLTDAGSSTGLRVLVAWYAYLNGQQIWLLGVGPVVQEGNSHKAYLDVWIYSGGDFPPFHAAQNVLEKFWGTFTLWFNGCDAGEFAWSTNYPGFSSGSIPIERITNLFGTTCNPNLGGNTINDDHGNTWQTGTQLINSGGVNGSIETVGDTDVFRFSLSNSNSNVRIYSQGSYDTTGELFRISGNTEAFVEYDDDDGDGLNFLIERTLDSGEYSVHVKGIQGTGNYSIWLESSDAQQQTLRVDFENRLLKDIRVLKNGQSLGIVPATETRGDYYLVNVGDQFSFEVVQNFGDAVAGVWPVINAGNMTDKNYFVNNIIGSNYFFIPFITNNTNTDRLLGVNMELEHENRCNCTIPAFTANVVAGYFHWYSNSNVRLYETGSNYTGQYWFWDSFTDDVQADTGKISFIFN